MRLVMELPTVEEIQAQGSDSETSDDPGPQYDDFDLARIIERMPVVEAVHDQSEDDCKLLDSDGISIAAAGRMSKASAAAVCAPRVKCQQQLPQLVGKHWSNQPSIEGDERPQACDGFSARLPADATLGARSLLTLRALKCHSLPQ
jgi:hypothetical protein